MAAQRIFKSSLNWTELAQKIPSQKQASLSAFKSKCDGYLRRVLSTPETPPQIDWNYYKQNASNKAVVEQFEKAYNALKIPYPDDNGYHAVVDQQAKEFTESAKMFVTNSNERIKKYEDEIQMFKETLPCNEMTMEEFYLTYPELSFNFLEKPRLYPNQDCDQYTIEDLQFYRQGHCNVMHKGDEYHPPTPPPPPHLKREPYF